MRSEEGVELAITMNNFLSVDRRISHPTPVIFHITTSDKSIYPRRRVMPPITVYTKPACVQCNATFRALDKAGISYETIDVPKTPTRANTS